MRPTGRSCLRRKTCRISATATWAWAVGLKDCHCCYVFETDADLAFARERKLTDWLDRETREQLVSTGCPQHFADQMRVTFTTHEDVVRKTGGDYRIYFS